MFSSGAIAFKPLARPPRCGENVAPAPLPEDDVKTAAELLVPASEPSLRLSAAPGRLALSFLGVGGGFSTTMLQSNIVVVKGRTHLMIDMGTKASLALHGAGLAPLDIENLLPTHSHADHVGGIEEWCLKSRYGAPRAAGGVPGERKPRLFATADYARILWDETLRGGLAHSKERRGGGLMALEDYVDLRLCEPVADRGRPVFGCSAGEGDDAISLKLMRTNHIPGAPFESPDSFFSVGVLVDDRVLVSGDTMFDRDLVEEFGAGVEAIFHDCQARPGGVHASYEELASLPPDLKRKMFLYHLTDGIAQEFAPADDGFAGWAVDHRAGVYAF
jgi:ribonuclease BN (tRNA processing enzyme)